MRSSISVIWRMLWCRLQRSLLYCQLSTYYISNYLFRASLSISEPVSRRIDQQLNYAVQVVNQKLLIMCFTRFSSVMDSIILQATNDDRSVFPGLLSTSFLVKRRAISILTTLRCFFSFLLCFLLYHAEQINVQSNFVGA